MTAKISQTIRLCDVGAGKLEGESAASSRTRLVGEGTALGFCQATRDRGPEPGPTHVRGLPRWPIKGLEDPVLLVRWHAGAAVAHGDGEMLVVSPCAEFDRQPGRR